jgi:hypothetical protein
VQYFTLYNFILQRILFLMKKYSKQHTVVRALTYYMTGVKRFLCLSFVLFNSISFLYE